MKTHFLFPSRFRTIGYAMFIPAFTAALLIQFSNAGYDSLLSANVLALASGEVFSDPVYFGVIENSIVDELVLVMLIVGGVLAGFSKLKVEDEFTGQIRYESLVWATYANFAVMILATLFVYGTYFLTVMMANLFTLLLFFLIRFEIKLKASKNDSDDQ